MPERELTDEERFAILRKYGLEPNPVIEYYKKQIDRKALRAAMRLTPEERLQRMCERQPSEVRETRRNTYHVDPKRYPNIVENPSPEDLKRFAILRKYGLEPDPVIEAMKQDVDRSLLRRNLELTPSERLLNLSGMLRFVEELRRAGHEAGRN